MCEKMKAQHGKGTNNDDSVASTLHSTDELEVHVYCVYTVCTLFTTIIQIVINEMSQQ